MDKVRLRIAYLKQRARVHYETYQCELGAYDCGRALAEQINPRMASAKVLFNSAMDELSTIDPDCPDARL